MNQLTIFDYANLDPETRIVVQQKTGEIRGLMRRAAQDIVDIGLRLIEVKGRLPHGQFGPWLRAEFEWDERQGRRFVAVAQRFGKSDNLSAIAPSALYLLAAPSTPEEARNEALELARNGETITHARAKEIVVTHAVTSREQIQESDDSDEAVEPILDEAGILLESSKQAATLGDFDEAKEFQQEAKEVFAVAQDLKDARKPLPLAPQGGKKLAGYITLNEWESASREQRAAWLLTRDDTSKFNSQGDNESIEWALWSWNPVTGCRHNCPYCYARDIADRFYEQKFEPSLWPARLSAPSNTPFPEARAREWMGHKNVFTCSMADLFGRWVPSEWIEAVLDAVRSAPQWNFLFLTKFPQRMAEFRFPDNAWVGTTVDCQARVANAEKAFRKIKAGVKWLSCEPLIEPLKFKDLGAFDWLVIGGASKSAITPEWHPPRSWVEAIEKQARELGVKVYEKANLLKRICQYPGIEDVEPSFAPPGLKYLPEVTG